MDLKRYRALRKEDNKLVFGWHCKIEDKHYIIPNTASICYGVEIISPHDFIEGFVEVISETISRSIGKFDKNNREIYAGLDNSGGNRGGDTVRQLGAEGELRWDDYLFCYVIQMDVRCCSFNPEDPDTEVIGDILINPELLK